MILLRCVVLLALGAPAVAADEADTRLFALATAPAPGDPAPIVRVGLEPRKTVSVESPRPFRMIDPVTGRDVWKASHDAAIHVATDGTGAAQPAAFRVQVGAFGSASAAEDELRRLAGLTGSSGVVRHDPDRDTWRVRLGSAGDRAGLAGLVETLREAGIGDGWIVEEAALPGPDATLRLVDAAWVSWPSGLRRVAVVPVPGEPVTVDGKGYRGLVELRVAAGGQVRPVNWVDLESYLRGVVPAEMGPEVWPEIEALEAQAVAARTYAWRNRGQFADEGFDLCATPRCQVYEGMAIEHPVSDAAVRDTRGEILTYKGDPIQALYTATCGGRTEDGKEVFPERDEPYLRGVPCRAGPNELTGLRTVLTGVHAELVLDETGTDVTRDWGLLLAAGIVPAARGTAASARLPLDARTLRDYTSALADRSRRPRPEGRLRATHTLAQAVTALLAEVGWSERAELLLSDDDVAAVLREPEAAALEPRERRALAWLAMADALRPFDDGMLRPAKPASRARLAPALVRIGEPYRAFGLQEAVFAGPAAKGGQLRLRGEAGPVERPVAAGARLFAMQSGRASPTERLELWPGDRLRYRMDPRGAIDFLELRPPNKGASDDRSSKVYSWETRRTRAELQEAIDRRLSVGRLRDLVVVRRGVSGRVLELKVVGDAGTATVRGFDVRRLLDLRESLFVLDLQRDPAGEIEAAVFTGKGWGHGVGLCQVGAYGMALRGASHREILAHYYRGATLASLDPAKP